MWYNKWQDPIWWLIVLIVCSSAIAPLTFAPLISLHLISKIFGG